SPAYGTYKNAGDLHCPFGAVVALDLGGFENLRGLVSLVRRYLVQKTSEVLKTSEVWQAV
ncbi:MAG: hypothetical protein LH679_23640, partial [Cyanobacteria bacterium CAN_BIN43]|nr:hypothetical protein [Cyanobacteria bacterium CAN_BIN43]